MRTINKRALALVAAAIVALAACGGNSTSSKTGGGSASTAKLSISSFNRDFSNMASLKSLASKGKGQIGVILPDTTSSARYTEFDAPYLKKAFETAGLPDSQFKIQNAQGSDSTQLTDAQSDIAGGASVLVVDPLDSGVGASIENYAKQHGVSVIDYDRLTLGGSRQYYVSFNNVQVGKLLGQGLVTCAQAWNVPKPNVIVMHGAATDNNATLFSQGYESVLKPKFQSGGWTQAADTAGTWDAPTALTEFQQAYSAHPGVNAALIANDETGAPIVSFLKSQGIKPDTFPVTGQDSTLQGLQNVISGYQCGTGYKPIYEEAQAAAALSLFARAGQKPPSSLANGTSQDTQTHASVPSVLLTPEWVTPTNMEATVVADNFVPASQLCAGPYSADCQKYGIK